MVAQTNNTQLGNPPNTLNRLTIYTILSSLTGLILWHLTSHTILGIILTSMSATTLALLIPLLTLKTPTTNK